MAAEFEVIRRNKAATEPARNVIEHRGNETDIGVGRDSARFEARVEKLVDENFKRHAILQADGDGKRETVHDAGKGGAFLGHFDEDFAGAIVFVEPNGDVSFVSANAEFVGD